MAGNSSTSEVCSRAGASGTARAARWFLQSGIQAATGGVARYYRADVECNAPVSTEITGYTASTLLYLGARTGDARCLDAARCAGAFLTGRAWDSAALTFPFELCANGGRHAYFFDCGIISRALEHLWRATGDPAYLDRARECGESMDRHFGEPPAHHPVVALPECRALPYEPRWSREPGCYQLKAALAWLGLGEAARFERMLPFSIENARGFLPGASDDEKVMDRLHAFCYYLEALLPVASRPDCAESLACGIGNVAALLRRIRPAFVRSDVYAQLLRVRLHADALGAVQLDQDAAAEEVEAIPRFQFASEDPRTDGAFSFGIKNGALMPYANPVSTAFCVQALEMWRDYLDGSFDSDWRALI